MIVIQYTMSQTRGGYMKKLLIIAVLAILVLASISSTALAGGGKVRGENGQGSLEQIQIQDPPPFN
jgi:hypothetical protein